MKRILLSFLAVVVVLGLFAAVGYSGYRLGYTQGAQGAPATANGDAPQLRPFDNFGLRDMPRQDFEFERGFPRGSGRGGFPMMGFGFFSVLMWLGRLAVLALIIWFIYWLFTRSGWRLTRQTTESTPPRTNDEQVM